MDSYFYWSSTPGGAAGIDILLEKLLPLLWITISTGDILLVMLIPLLPLLWVTTAITGVSATTTTAIAGALPLLLLPLLDFDYCYYEEEEEEGDEIVTRTNCLPEFSSASNHLL